jgi:hypothetical protein
MAGTDLYAVNVTGMTVTLNRMALQLFFEIYGKQENYAPSPTLDGIGGVLAVVVFECANPAGNDRIGVQAVADGFKVFHCVY